MSSGKPQNKAFHRTVHFLRQLITEGVKHAVISPGSRSTPLTLAASTLPQLEKHVILDERSAAFTALGIGKATNQPAALICTSGTAAANYLPAVIEAMKSGVPLLLLTADRPARLHGTGANQTINQQQLFGNYPVLFKNISSISTGEAPLADLGNSAAQVFQTAVTKQGPVHLNIPLKKPLEPTQDFFQKIVEENKAQPDSADPPTQEDHELNINGSLLDEIQSAERPLIIIGQLTAASSTEPIYELANCLAAPVLSEQQARDAKLTIQHFDGFLRNTGNQSLLEPDVILRFGRQPASKSLLQAIKKWNSKKHIHFYEGERRSDIEDTTTDFIAWNGAYFSLPSLNDSKNGWLKKWKEAEQAFNKLLHRSLGNAKHLTDGHIYHYLTRKIPKRWSVFIGNSFSARDQSLFGRWKTQCRFTNRGASGIDGITSTAIGTNIGINQPGILFVGDLSFLHDTNALLNKSKLKQPLIVVVINNSGGSLFRMLPIAQFDEPFTPYFETPQEADITALAQSYGIDTQPLTTAGELKEIDLVNIAANNRSKLHVIECQTHADASMELRNELWSFEL